MASSSSATWLLSLKVLLISAGVVSIAMFATLSVPLMFDFAVNQVPLIWSAALSWLRPPYIYVVINGIIFTIAATSLFHQKSEPQSQPEPLVSPTPAPPPVDLDSNFAAAVPDPPVFEVAGTADVFYESEIGDPEVKDVVVYGSETGDVDEDDEFVISKSTWNPPQRMTSPEIQTDYLFPVTEKPLVSSRFGHRKPFKSSPEGGRALRVAKPRRHETFENTWKTITDGRHVPLTRHLKKSDTFDTLGRQTAAGTLDRSPPDTVLKSETFKDRTNYQDLVPAAAAASQSPPGRLRKEPSLSQDELNRRVEAFIRKFNEEMRLQRQESLNQYVEMINRGAH